MGLAPDPVTGLPKTTRAPLASGSFATPTVGGSPVLRAPAPAAPLASGSFATPIVNGSPVLTPAVTAPSTPPPPDYQGQITADPIYQQTQADISSARTADQARLDQARQRAVIDFGALPDLSQYGSLTGDLSGSLSDLIGQLAGQNTAAGLSTTARINKAHDDAVAASKANLTARGLLSSGETGYQLGQQDLSYRQSQSDAVRALLDGLSGLQNSYLSAEAQRKASLAQAASDAAGRIQIPAAPVGGTGGASGGAGQQGPYGITLTPEQQQQVANNQFPVLTFPDAPAAGAVPPIGNVPLSPDQRRKVDQNQFPVLNLPPPPVDLSPQQVADVANNDFPDMSFPTAPPASSVSPVGSVVLSPAQQASVAQNDYPQIDFGQVDVPKPKPKPKPKPSQAAGSSSVNNKVKGQGL